MAKPLLPGFVQGLKAGLVTGAVALPDTSNGFTVKKNVFSGKAFANVAINTAKKIVALILTPIPSPLLMALRKLPGSMQQLIQPKYRLRLPVR